MFLQPRLSIEHLDTPVGFLALCFLVSCTPSRPPTPSDVTGYYVFNYPAGQILQVEMLTINLDSTFHQEFYSTETAFRMGDRPDFENNGTWSLVEQGLRFSSWSSFCELNDPTKLLDIPRRTTLTVYWEPPTDGHDARIDVWSEDGYVFQRTTSPEPAVKQMHIKASSVTEPE